MGTDFDASEGQCLIVARPRVSESKLLLAKAKVNVSENATDQELTALAWGIKQVQSQRNGLPLPGLFHVKIIYQDSDDVWNQEKGPVEINRGWANDRGMNSQNIGMVLHELGHFVGNNRDPQNQLEYGKYFKAVPTPCNFTHYSKKNRNEEFAEVFSAFLVHPENLLQDNFGSCRLAFDYFRKHVFSKGMLSVCRL